MPKIDVVATQNCFDKIDTIMLNLFRQEEQDIVCIDDASTDRTSVLLQQYAKFDKRVKIIALNASVGVVVSVVLLSAQVEFCESSDSFL